MGAALPAGAAFAAVLIASVHAQAPTPMQQPSIALGGPATTVTIAGVVPYTYYSATAPGFPNSPQTSIVSGAIATPTGTTTWTIAEYSTTTTLTETGYYTTLGSTTYFLNDAVPLSVWAPGNYPCPTGFLNRNGQCFFCPSGFYWDRTSCVPSYIDEPLQCNDGYITTNSANGASSCVATTTTTSPIPTDNCPNGYSTVFDAEFSSSDCVYGTNVVGGPPALTLGGPVVTTTTAGFTVTEYSAALLLGDAYYYTTLTGSPTATITVGSLGMVTVTQYDSAVLPVPYAHFVTSVASSSGSSSAGVDGVAAPGSSSSSGSGSSSAVLSSAMPASSTFAASSSPSSASGAGATSGTTSSSSATTTSASTSVPDTSAAASASASPYKGGAVSLNIDSTLAGLSMLGALLLTAIVAL